MDSLEQQLPKSPVRGTKLDDLDLLNQAELVALIQETLPGNNSADYVERRVKILLVLQNRKRTLLTPDQFRTLVTLTDLTSSDTDIITQLMSVQLTPMQLTELQDEYPFNTVIHTMVVEAIRLRSLRYIPGENHI